MGRLFHAKVSPPATQYKKIAVLIPAYKEDSVILQSAAEAVKQNYPSNKFKVFVIADKLQPETIVKLKAVPVDVIEVGFEKSTKIKSLNVAINVLGSEFDSIVILDSDNIMNTDFLERMNNELQAGFKAVQGHRIAKNENTQMAFLDAMSEEINNHIFRKGHFTAGFSSALIGSAMAFDYHLFKSMIQGIDSVGEDKELEVAILRERVTISYVEEAYVYDEKVQDMEVFGNQRKRWLSSQLSIFRKYFFSSFVQLFKNGNLDYFNKVFQSALIPRVLLLGFLAVFACSSVLLPVFPTSLYWIGLFSLYIFTLMLAIPSRFYTMRLLMAALKVPMVFIKMFFLLFKLKGAGKSFVHTPHSVTVTSKKD
jgi:cellulose synthase/poly-beta-1,6-N-acetylglucosamine synthase-like glycosyltransferase